MRASINWLNEYLSDVKSLDGLSETLTSLGIEVEEELQAAKITKTIVVGVVNKVRKVEGTKLRSCVVDAGEHGSFEVVCAAKNLRASMRSAFALIGTKLGEIQIQSREVAGVVSKGMLCSEAELGIGEEAEKIMDLGRAAKAGTALNDLLENEDKVFDVAITPNRGDWLSILGVARELAAKTGNKLKTPRMAKLANASDDKHNVSIAEDTLKVCPKFTCISVSGIKADRPTPALIAARLKRCEIRPVSIIVDITNYVMLELGHPIHAFDRDKIEGAINVRFAKQDEELTLLDGTKVKLKADIVTIADEKKALAIGGVMGGLDSAVTDSTTNILVEAAHFVPSTIRGRTREFNINSDAAFRFERGVDPTLSEIAATLTAKLIAKYCGGNCGTINVAGAVPKTLDPISLEVAKIEKRTGVIVDKKTAVQRLKALGCQVTAVKNTLSVVPPSWRFDLELNEDLIEEVIRLGGYDQVPITMPLMSGEFTSVKETLIDEKSIRDRLVATGYNEIITYAFVAPKWENDYYANQKPLELANPLAPEQSVMRTGLIGGLIDRANYNQHRRQESLRLFEIGRCFLSIEDQPIKLAGLCWGKPTHWDSNKRGYDYFDARGTVETILNGIELDFESCQDHPAFHPSCSANIFVAGNKVGIVGELHPKWINKTHCNLEPAPCLFELDLDAFTNTPHQRTTQPLSKFPLITRDLAMVVNRKINASKLIKAAQSLSLEELINVEVFDSFTSDKMDAGMRSIGLRLTMQGTVANLVDENIRQIVTNVADHLTEKFRAQIRQ